MLKSIDFSSLGFNYHKTNCHIEYSYFNNKWSNYTLKKKSFLDISVAASCLNYGQVCFEGLKCFRCKDGTIRSFRSLDSLIRINSSARYICIPEISIDMFNEAINKVVAANIDYVPPYHSTGALYLRPLILGVSSTLGIKPSEEYRFLIFVTPVSDYYNETVSNGMINAIVFDKGDRTTVSGSGANKIGGNYAITLKLVQEAKARGYQTVLFLDPLEHKYIDEFPTSNFIAISKEGNYLTPKSKTILPSITNKALMQIAKDLGIKIEERQIDFNEISNFSEIGACGTAVVISYINKIVKQDKIFFSSKNSNKIMRRLSNILIDIQKGNIVDKYNWMKLIK